MESIHRMPFHMICIAKMNIALRLKQVVDEKICFSREIIQELDKCFRIIRVNVKNGKISAIQCAK
jgi:hypothetical protein